MRGGGVRVQIADWLRDLEIHRVRRAMPGSLVRQVRKAIRCASSEAGGRRGLGALMSDDYKIYVDAGQPATLNNGAGVLTDCATLQEAVLAWHGLTPEQKIRATVKVIGGRVYRA